MGAVTLHVAELGEGPPLMLLHGWPEDHRTWRDVAPLLAERWRVVMPDLRGFGWSDAPTGDYRKQALADDVIGLLDALGFDRVGLVGHDWGGWIGFLVALTAPERVRGYVALNIAHPWMRVSWNPARLAAFFYMPIVGTPWLGPWLMRNTHAVRGLLRGGVAKGNRLDDAAIAGFVRMIQEPGRAEASSALYRQFLLRELPGLRRAFRDRRLAVPVRVVFGRRDPAVHPSQIEGLEHRAPAADYVWVDDAGHFVAEERPERVAAAIAAFFDDLPDPSGA